MEIWSQAIGPKPPTRFSRFLLVNGKHSQESDLSWEEMVHRMVCLCQAEWKLLEAPFAGPGFIYQPSPFFSLLNLSTCSHVALCAQTGCVSLRYWPNVWKISRSGLWWNLSRYCHSSCLFKMETNPLGLLLRSSWRGCVSLKWMYCFSYRTQSQLNPLVGVKHRYVTFQDINT